MATSPTVAPRSPPYAVADPAIKACDFGIPNLNNALVEYEVALKRLLENGTLARSSGDPSIATPPLGSSQAHPGIVTSDARNARAVSLGPSISDPKRFSPPQQAAIRASSIGPESVSGTQNSLRARQTNDAAAAAWDASIEQMLNAAAIGNYEGSAFSDDAHVSALLRLYLNGDLLYSMTRTKAPDLYESMMALRRDHVFPMVTASKAAYGALIAYVQTTPGIPIQPDNEHFARWHLNLALSLVNFELADPQRLDSDSVILTVVLLMVISQRQNDMATFRAHAQGLLTLTVRRQLSNQEARSHPSMSPIPDASSPYLSDTYSDHESLMSLSPVSSSWQEHPTPFGSIPPPTSAPSGPTPTSNPQLPVRSRPDVRLHTGPTRLKEPAGDEFHHLVAKGLITADFADSQQFSLVANAIVIEARYDWVLALALAQHMWTDGDLATGMPPLENAIFNAARICLHLAIWPVTSRPCVIALRCVSGLRQSLLECPNFDMLHFTAPSLLVWMALAAGPLALGHARAWFALLLRRAAPLTNLRTFADAVDMATAQYSWSPTMTLVANVFWVAVLYPHAFDDSSLAAFSRHGAATAPYDDPSERAQCWMLAQRLKLEARAPLLKYADGPGSRAGTLADVTSAEAALVKDVMDAAFWEVDPGPDGGGRRRPVIWIPPSPPCLLGARCEAHGGGLGGGGRSGRPASGVPGSSHSNSPLI